MPTDQIRVFYPPVDLVGPTVAKLQESGAPAVLLVPEWPRQARWLTWRHDGSGCLTL